MFSYTYTHVSYSIWSVKYNILHGLGVLVNVWTDYEKTWYGLEEFESRNFRSLVSGLETSKLRT